MTARSGKLAQPLASHSAELNPSQFGGRTAGNSTSLYGNRREQAEAAVTASIPLYFKTVSGP